MNVMKKRMLSLLLVLCMLLPMVPVMAFPAAAVEPIVYKYADAYGNFTKTISETYVNEKGLGMDDYQAWL